MSTRVLTKQVSVLATATKLTDVRTGRESVIIENHGTTAVYIGEAGVTTATGMLLPGVLGASISIQTAASLYAIAATGTQTVSVVELY